MNITNYFSKRSPQINRWCITSIPCTKIVYILLHIIMITNVSKGSTLTSAVGRPADVGLEPPAPICGRPVSLAEAGRGEPPPGGGWGTPAWVPALRLTFGDPEWVWKVRQPSCRYKYILLRTINNTTSHYKHTTSHYIHTTYYNTTY